jgi:hypothetical protein
VFIFDVAFRVFLFLIGWFMVFNATFNNMSAISWRSFLLVGDTGVPEENDIFSRNTGVILFVFEVNYMLVFFVFFFVCLLNIALVFRKNDFTEYLRHNWPWLCSYRDFLGRWLERPRQLLNKGILTVKLQSSLLRSPPWFG